MWGGGSVFGGSGGSGGAGGGGGADGVSIPYYNQNFELLYKQMVTDGTTGVVTTSFLTAQPNEIVNTGTETDSESGDVTVTSLVGPRAKNAMVIGDAMLVWDAVNNAIKVVGIDGSTAANLYATGGVSALGYGPGGGGGGASALTDLLDVAISNPTNGQVLMYNSSTGKWYNGTVQSGGGGTVTSITAGTGLTGGTITTSGTIALSEDTLSAIDAGVTAYGWGDHAQAGYLTSSAISDMATKTWVGQQGFLTSSSLTGYATQPWVEQQGYITASALTGYATQQWVQRQGYLTSVSFSNLTSHPTTIEGYGITDAKIQNGTITLGSNSITPLTSHQTVSGTFWGQSWSNGGTVKGSISAGSNGGVIEQFHCIELNNAGSLSDYGGYIDFHYNGSAADYTTRLIESEAGVMLIQAKNSASPYADKVVGLKIGSNVTGESYVQIGNVKLVYDATNNALKVEKGDGTAANFYATGGVSALGFGSGSGGSVENLNITDTLSFSSNGYASEIFQDGDGQLWLYGQENIVMGNDVHMEGYNFYTDGGTIDADAGYMKAARFYVGANRYIYLDGTTLKYNDNGTVKTIVLS